MADPMATIFISYAYADIPFVDRLQADLRQQDFDPWVDRQHLKGGQRWRRELQDAVKRAQVLLIVLSPDAVASKNVQIEYNYALDLGNVVIPLHYRQCEVPMELRAIQWIDFRQSYEQGIEALLQALHSQQHQISLPASPPSTNASTVGTLKSSGSQPELPAPHPWNVPFGRNPFFTGRSELLERLHEQLSHSRSAALNQSAALSGLGGIGKTQTAIEYAYRYRDEYSAVLWVRADNHETLVADYGAIARLLSLSGHGAQEQMQVVAAFKRWLQEHEGWLLILDNADDLSLLPDFLPTGGKGQLLLTTRAQATGKLARSLPVEKLEFSEGMQLLLHRAKVLEEDEPLENVSAAGRKAAQQLVEELDGLPLALDQAGAYMEETSCSLSDYLALYTRSRLALLKRQSSMSTDYPHTVASTWALSFSQVEQADPAAADLLRLCAFLHPDAIPEAILTEGATELGPRLQEVAANPLLLNEAIQLLRRYSLVKRDSEEKILVIHRLVQAVLKESLDPETQQQWAERTVRAVNAAFPHEEFPAWERCERLLPHALCCAKLIVQHDFRFPEAAQLLHAAGHYLLSRRQLAQAEPLLQQALSMREQVLGSEHPETARTLNRLAELYMFSGKYEQAERLLEPALAAFERLLGPENPEVTFTLNTLAGVYLYTGRFVQAEPLYQRALAIGEQALGSTHPLLAESLNGLAILYEYQGKYAQVEPLYQRALAILEQAVGPEHPETLSLLNNLASFYHEQGKYAQAEALYRRTLTLQERVLGAENLDTIMSLLWLGRLLTRRGQYQQAEALLQRTHTLSEHVLGLEHPVTLNTLVAQARLAQARHQDALAASLYQQALSGFEHVLGPAHHYVAEPLTGLARFYIHQGDYAQAEPLLQRALTINEHAFGPVHRQTATVLDAQGHLALLQGQEEQAASLLQRTLAIREQAFGPDHPDVAQTLQHLAELSEKQGQREQAQSLYQRALSIREQVLGPDHPETITTREAIARLDQIVQEPDGKGISFQPQTKSVGLERYYPLY